MTPQQTGNAAVYQAIQIMADWLGPKVAQIFSSNGQLTFSKNAPGGQRTEADVTELYHQPDPLDVLNAIFYNRQIFITHYGRRIGQEIINLAHDARQIRHRYAGLHTGGATDLEPYDALTVIIRLLSRLEADAAVAQVKDLQAAIATAPSAPPPPAAPAPPPPPNIQEATMTTDYSPSLEDVEFADNPEPRCTCVILVDTSGSMGGEPIAKMNEALQVFASEIKQDSLTARRVDAAVIAFNHEVQLVTDFTSGLDFTPPSPLRAYGGTRIAAAVLDGLERCEARKEVYRANNIAYFRSFLMVLTDGFPEHDSPEDIAAAAAAVRDAEQQRRAAVRCFALPGADVRQIQSIIPSTHPTVMDPSKLPDALEWLANSMSAVSQSQPGDAVRLPPTDFLDF